MMAAGVVMGGGMIYELLCDIERKVRSYEGWE